MRLSRTVGKFPDIQRPYNTTCARYVCIPKCVSPPLRESETSATPVGRPARYIATSPIGRNRDSRTARKIRDTWRTVAESWAPSRSPHGSADVSFRNPPTEGGPAYRISIERLSPSGKRRPYAECLRIPYILTSPIKSISYSIIYINSASAISYLYTNYLYFICGSHRM